MVTDIVSKAEKIIKDLPENIKKENEQNKIRIKLITTSQIRKFLSSVNILKNKIDSYKVNNLGTKILSDDLAMEIKFLRVNILYQARDKSVDFFVKQTNLLSYIDKIGKDIDKFDEFYKYMEALVAFHKYYGGRD